MSSVANAQSATDRALAAVGKTDTPRDCLIYVQTWLGIPAKYPTAIAAWTLAVHKHPGDYNAPAGVPVFFAPNHVALSVGAGNIVSSDWPTSGHIGKTTIRNLEKSWSHPYLGWTSDLEGINIDGIGKTNSVATPIGLPNPVPGVADSTIQLGQIFSTLSDPARWKLVAYFFAGAALCLFAIWKSSPAVHSLTTETVKKVGSYATS